MYSNFSDNETIQRGRKKVYSATEKLELLLPNGKNDGFLEVGDLIYVVQSIKSNGNSAFRFRVMKFADSKKEGTVYSAEKKYFKPYFENKSQVEGEEKDNSSKPKYIVPTITSLGGGVLAYLIGKKYQKNAIMFGVGGLAVGLAVGIYLLNRKKEDKK